MLWHKLSFPCNSQGISDAYRVQDLAKKRAEELNKPVGFGTYSGIERNNPDKFVVMFSPVAASSCSGILAQWGAVKCSEPRPEELEGLGGSLAP